MSEEDRIVNELLERNGKIRLARKVYKLENIIKEVREYIEMHTDKLKTTRIPKIDFNYKELLEILDKENK